MTHRTRSRRTRGAVCAAAAIALIGIGTSAHADVTVSNFDGGSLNGWHNWGVQSMTTTENPTGGTGWWGQVTTNNQWWGQISIQNWDNGAVINPTTFNRQLQARIRCHFPSTWDSTSTTFVM